MVSHSENILTHLSGMDFTFISRMSPFSILGVLGGIYHFYSIFNIPVAFCKQTMQVQGRTCTVYLCTQMGGLAYI